MARLCYQSRKLLMDRPEPCPPAERWLKLLLRLFGGTSAFAIFPFFMPQDWMAATHRWLGMGALPDPPIVEYLARATSGLCAFYGGLLLLLAMNVRRFARIITYQAVVTIALSGAGALFGLQAGMPGWWMAGDLAACWFFCGAMLFCQLKLKQSDATIAK